jgi:hypothetical protein
MKLRLASLIDFYDKEVRESQRHASAINAVMGEDLAIALLTHYFCEKGFQVKVLARVCTTGKQKGPRLDAWIEVCENSVVHHYQAEIKNWSAHSIGGRSIRDDEDMRKYRLNRWKKRFDEELRLPRDDEARKVLTPMNLPGIHSNIRPLLIFWEAMHPKGDAIEFFDVEVSSANFDRLWIFSLSTFVRNLISRGIESLDVEMLFASQRIEWLTSRFFVRPE